MDINFDEIIFKIHSGEYKPVGFGSCRRVYDMNNGCVVKVARDIRGIDQNRAENDIYNTRKSNFFARVEAVSNDYKLLIMVKAGKIRNMKQVLQYYRVRNINALVRTNHFIEDIMDHKLSKGDLVRVSSWGIVDSIPVMIDYGLTRSIYIKYYRLNFLGGKRFRVINYQ